MFVIGLDLSTSVVGWCILHNNVYINSGWYKFKKTKDLYGKLDQFSELFQNILKENDIQEKEIIIALEEPVKMFKTNASMAQTISLLQRWNGMVSGYLYGATKVRPDMINAATARKKIGLTVKRDKTKKTKEVVADYVVSIEPELNKKKILKKTGKVKDEFYDMTDAYVVAKALTLSD